MKKENQQNDLTKGVRKAFEDYKVEADPFVWENIQNELQQDKKRSFALWWKYGAAASIVILLSVSVWYTNTFQQNVSTAEQRQSSQPNTPDAAISTPLSKHENDGSQPTDKVKEDIASPPANKKPIREKTDRIIKAGGTLTSSSAQKVKNVPSNRVEKAETFAKNENKSKKIEPYPSSYQLDEEISKKITSLTSTSEKNTSVILEEDMKDTNNIALNAPVFVDTIQQKPIRPSDIDLGLPLEENTPSGKNQNNGWFIAANFQSSQGTDPASSSSLSFEKKTESSFSNTDNVPTSTFTAIPAENREFQGLAFGDREYFPPVIMSITANRSLSRKWGIESGISFTQLSARRKTIEGSIAKAEENERLRFIGIPLLINYNLITKNRFVSFIASGFVVDKGIEYKSKLTFEDERLSGKSVHQKMKGFRYSFMLGLGLEYRFYKHFSLFVQPGISFNASTTNLPHGFDGDNASGYQPNLRFGIRFHP